MIELYLQFSGSGDDERMSSSYKLILALDGAESQAETAGAPTPFRPPVVAQTEGSRGT